jgi:LuxR family transcriptional regulator, quorum-sensing system regulator CviR
MSIYTTNQWNNIDPLHKVNFTQFKLQYWSDTFKQHGEPENMRSVFDDFNIKDGYAYGVRNISGNKGSIFCFAAEKMKKEKRTELILELLVPHYHETLNRILSKNHADRTILSPREEEIMKWIMQGKNTWEVSIILKISERTVKFHIDNIMKKLDAVNRTHAVAIALRENLIALD